MNILSKVDLLLLHKKLTKSWLAEKLGIDRQNLNKLLNDDSIKLVTLKKIAQAFEIDLFELLAEEGASVEEPNAEYQKRQIAQEFLEEKLKATEELLEKEKLEKLKLLELSAELVKKIKSV